LSLKSQNEEIVERYDDDARRLRVKEDEVRSLTQSIQLYQEEREKLARAYEQLKSRLQLAAHPLATSFLVKLAAYAKGKPGCEFAADDGEAVVTISTDLLFEPGTDRLKPGGEALLRSFADLLDAPEASAVGVLVEGHTDAPTVVRAGLQEGPAPKSHLGLDRAVRVRDLMTLATHLDAGRIEAAGFESARPREDGPNDAARARNRRIEIHLRSAAPSAAGAAPSHP
jgi:chemotaxis protein MotB